MMSEEELKKEFELELIIDVKAMGLGKVFSTSDAWEGAEWAYKLLKKKLLKKELVPVS